MKKAGLRAGLSLLGGCDSLELESGAKLQDALIAERAYGAERAPGRTVDSGARDVTSKPGVDSKDLRVVEEVEYVHADLQIHRFLEPHEFGQRGIPVGEARAAQRIPMQIADLSVQGTSKRVWIEPVPAGLPGIWITNEVGELSSSVNSLQIAVSRN